MFPLGCPRAVVVQGPLLTVPMARPHGLADVRTVLTGGPDHPCPARLGIDLAIFLHRLIYGVIKSQRNHAVKSRLPARSRWRPHSLSRRPRQRCGPAASVDERQGVSTHDRQPKLAARGPARAVAAVTGNPSRKRSIGRVAAPSVTASGPS